MADTYLETLMRNDLYQIVIGLHEEDLKQVHALLTKRKCKNIGGDNCIVMPGLLYKHRSESHKRNPKG